MPAEKPELNHALKIAGHFDVHKWSDYPAIKAITDAFYDEVVSHRKTVNPKARIHDPKQIKKHLRVLLLNLYVSACSATPWLGVSRNKSAFQEKSRYRKIFLTYDFLIPLINDLVAMCYIEQKLGFKDRRTGIGYRTRIKATQTLLDRIYQPEFELKQAEEVGLVNLVIDNPEAERETIILRDIDKKNMEYEDTKVTLKMRDNLRVINQRLRDTTITLRISNDLFASLEEQLQSSDEDQREHIDFTRTSLCRVFNEDFQHGGRFYGGWWIGLPKEYRKHIEINGKETVEVDFSAHHIRMLYAKDGLNPPADPYEIENCPFSRSDLKQVFLILINANGLDSTIKACWNQGITDAEQILHLLEKAHYQIAHYFYSGMGLTLQFEDSVLAEEVMFRMLEQSGATVLPVHDSFIVRNSYEEELRTVMEDVFSTRYKCKPAMKTNQTVLDKPEHKQEGWENETLQLLDISLEDIKHLEEQYTSFHKYWGKG